MLSAKINLNGIETLITGDKEDILYVLQNTISSSIPAINDIVQKISNTEIKSSTNKETKSSKYSKEDAIKMYKYLASQGNFKIKQFEITRGGKKDPVQFTVCLVFDETKQRYCFYNPKTEDSFIKTYSVEEAIEKTKASESGFSLIHSVANRIAEKISILEDLTKIVSVKTDPFPKDEIVFKNYEPKKHSSSSYRSGMEKVMDNKWYHVNDIWKRMSKIGFVSQGKTPQATIASILYTDVKKDNSIFEKERKSSRFRLKKKVNSLFDSRST